MKVAQEWTPDVIIGRTEKIHCLFSAHLALYRQFRQGLFDQEKCGKQAFKKNISERLKDYPHFKDEFGHLEGDTIVGVHHKSAVITLVERVSKAIITLKPNRRKAQDIETDVNRWFQPIPKKLFKSITFDCGK